MAYLSSRGPLGLQSARGSLHIVGTDGSGDRVLIEDLGDIDFSPLYDMLRAGILFSPDGATVAMKAGGVLYAVPLSGGPPVVIHLAGTPLERARLTGWRPDGSEIILVATAWGESAETTVAACDPRMGSVRTVYSAATDPWMLLQDNDRGHYNGIDHLPVIIQNPGPGDTSMSSLVLLDLSDGSTRTIADQIRGVTEISPDGDRLAYGDSSELRIVDLKNMRTRTIGRIEATASRILLSPSAGRVMVQQRGHDGRPLPLAVFDPTGPPTELPEGWSIPIGWSGRNRVIVGHDDPSGFIRRLALADAATGTLREIYPGTGLIQ